MFAASTQFFIMSPLLPQISRQYCVDKELLGLLIGAYSLSLGVSALFSGFVSDQIGRRKVLLIGSFFMGLMLLLHALAFDFYSLLTLRFLTGVAGGLLTGSCIAYIRDFFPFQFRARANGLVLTGSALGQILGVPIAVILGEAFGIQSPFFVLGIIMMATHLLILRVLREPIDRKEGVPQIATQQVIKEYKSLITQPFYQKAAYGYMLMFFSLSAYLVYFPQWLEQIKGAKPVDIAFAFSLGGIGALLAGPVGGYLSDKAGRKPVILAANLSLAGIMGLSLFSPLDVYWASATFAVFMFLMSARSVAFQSFISDSTCDLNRGKGLNLMIAIGQVGMILGAVLAGPVYANWGFQFNAIIAGVFSIGMAVLVSTKWPLASTITIQESEQSSNETNVQLKPATSLK